MKPVRSTIKLPLTTQFLGIIIVSILVMTLPIGFLAYSQYSNRLLSQKIDQQIIVAHGLANALKYSDFVEVMETGRAGEVMSMLQSAFDSVAHNSGSHQVMAGRIVDDYFEVFIEGLRPMQARMANFGDRLPLTHFSELAWQAQTQGVVLSTGVVTDPVTGIPLVRVYVPILNLNNQVVGLVTASEPTENLMPHSLEFAVYMATTAAGLLILFMWLPVWWISNKLKRPLLQLEGSILSMAGGDISETIERGGVGEISALFQALSALQDELKDMVHLSEQISTEIIEGTLLETQLNSTGKGEFSKVTTSLMSSKNTLIQYLQDMSAVVVILNRDGYVVFMNKTGGHYGYQAEEVINRHMSEVLSEEVVAQFSAGIDKARITRERVRLTVTFKEAPIGGTHTISYDLIPILDRHYKITSYLLFGYDISDLMDAQVKIEASYQQTKVQLSKLAVSHKLANLLTYEVHLTPGESLTMESPVGWSEELRSHLGHGQQSTMREYYALIHEEDREIFDSLLVALLNPLMTDHTYEYRVRHAQGHYLYMKDHTQIVRDADNHIVLIHGAMLDMSDYHELLASEVEQRKAAQLASEAKSSFLSMMSHEIRTPMNAILGNIEIQLMDTSLSPHVIEAFHNIHTAGNTLLSLINDILDMSKVENNRLEILNFKYDLPSLVVDICYVATMSFEHKPIDFVVDVDPGLPMYLLGDEIRLKQVMNNLLSNAFKYTQQGQVTLKIGFEPTTDPEQVMLVLTVEDTGSGMKPEEVKVIFEKYARFNTEENKNLDGVGLGMNITYGLVQLMQGHIEIDSVWGQGSRFTIRLPQTKVDEQVVGYVVADDLRHFRSFKKNASINKQFLREPMPYGRVLVVDDVETNLHVAEGLLKPYQLQIERANSGYEAIKKIKAGKHYDVIFMDHMMPGLDGVETLKILRQEHDYTGAIVALTANALVTQAQSFMEQGFDDYISKPIDTRHLNLLLNRWVRDRYPVEIIDDARREHSDKETFDLDTHEDNPQVLRVFLRDVQRLDWEVRELLQDQAQPPNLRFEHLRAQVHKVKGLLASMGSKKLLAQAITLEELGRAGKLVELEKGISALMKELRELSIKLTEHTLVLQEQTTFNTVLGHTEASYLLPEFTQVNTQQIQVLLSQIEIACQALDSNRIEQALTALKQERLSSNLVDLTNKIHDLLLHSEFDEILTLMGTELNPYHA